MAAALIALAVPTTAGAAAEGGEITLQSGEERTNGFVTYDFWCELYPGDSSGASARLSTTGGAPWHDAVMNLTTDTANERRGTFGLTYSNVPPGTYYLDLTCFRTESNVTVRRVVTVLPALTSTTTALTANRSTFAPGDQVTFTATVSDPAATGTITFSADGSPIDTQTVVGGSASTTAIFPGTRTVTAVYSGDDAFRTSPSNAVTVTMNPVIHGPADVSISSPVRVGEPASVTDLGTWTPNGVTYSYAWKVDGQQVGTGTTYSPTAADVGKALTVTVTGAYPDATPVSVTSSASRPVDLGYPTTGDWDLIGTDEDENATLGTPLSIVTAGWPAGTTFTYRWQSDYVDIPGATSASYTPRAADLGKSLNVRVWVSTPGYESYYATFYAWSVVTTPTVTVGSSQVVVGSDAVVPVTVTGPAGGPVATGTVDVTLTPGSGTPTVVTGVALVDGSATVTVPGLAVGTYAVSVAYSGEAQMHLSFMLMSIPQSHAYLPATGSGTVRVTKPAPDVTVAATLAVQVATAGTLDMTLGSPRPERFSIREGSTVLVEGVVPATGTALAITLPVLAPGVHDLVIDLPESATTAAASGVVRVTVTGEPPRTGALPTADLATPKAATAPGQTMDLVAEGFEPGETVAFYLHSDPVFLGTAVAGADGVARLSATIPADVPVGAHTVIATGGTSGRWAQLGVVLAVPEAAPAAAPAATTPTLAATGAQAGGLMTGAWLLLVLGGGLVVLARKVRTAR